MVLPMALFFDGISALDCYRAMNLAGASVGAPKRYAREFAASSPNLASLKSARESFPSLVSPRLLVSEQSKRCRIQGVKCRVFGSPLPSEAFVFLGDNVYACSPAFAFTRSAVELDFAELVLLGYEITGNYRLDSTLNRDFFRRHRLYPTRRWFRFLPRAIFPVQIRRKMPCVSFLRGPPRRWRQRLPCCFQCRRRKEDMGYRRRSLMQQSKFQRGIGGLHTDGNSGAICYGRQRVFASSTIATCFTLVRRRSRAMRGGEMPLRPLASWLSQPQRAR